MDDPGNVEMLIVVGCVALGMAGLWLLLWLVIRFTRHW